ncbi:MAG: nitroreductase family protein [Chlorobium sp.]|nr:nitroreductase family protein [Chlorobiaceae bacterium]MCF8215317.1 nitroreductase family protein [Chlorobium sp.]MCF8270154.1 nitroreductase family protein [Chlorobium sp.]MCF8286524.1 nitroreductase family protein [Chlorobium sp.]MCF8290122.1 nitroreductase family protein [Chlorobium sp.]
MNFRDLVTRSRTYRRFDSSCRLDARQLAGLVELACYTPSSRNLQPLKYVAVSEIEECSAVYDCLSWAGYLPDWPGPVLQERPAAYLVMLCDLSISFSGAECDSGIAAQTIILGATDIGYGGCIVGSIDRDSLRTLLHIPDGFSIELVLALGKPVESVVIEQMEKGADVRYFRDSHDVHHVPKRTVDEVLLTFR